MSERAERLFEQALGLGPQERTAFIDAACVGDRELRQELLSLLNQADAAEDFFGSLHHAVFSASYPSVGEAAPESPSDAALGVGDMVGHYRIVSLIGSGGMGTVYRAHDTRLDRPVALKFLPPHLGGQPDAEDRILLEARAAAALEHPNVCSIHQIGEADDGRLFIAMACYEGETLKERLLRGALPVAESVQTAVQIARGLAAAHARGIIHRDVKPGNIMLVADGTVRLLDFGLATMTNSAFVTPGITPGTVSYMSPEQARADPLDPRTDLWSLGVVLYEMLSGLRPFRGENARTLLQTIQHKDPEPIGKLRPGLPRPLVDIVERLLQKDPAARYGSAAEALTDLTRALPPGQSAPGRSRKRATVLAVTLLLLLTLIGLGLWSRLQGGASVAAEGGAEPSIAVLPLANLSPDPGDAVLADRMTEELIAILGRTGELRVIGSTSAFAFRNHQLDLRRVADSLGVGNILEGSFRKTGSALRVQVRLVDGRNGATRWSQEFDRDFAEVLSVQDEIARAVTGELEPRSDPQKQVRRHQTRNIVAYELNLRGWNPVLLRSDSGVRQALAYFQQAIAADSAYAAPYAGLAVMYRRLGANSDPGMPLPQLHALADAAARKALALDDSFAMAHYALGRARLAAYDFAGAEVEIRRAIALDPNRALYRARLAELHCWAGRDEESLLEARRALAIEPLDPQALAGWAGALFTSGRYDEALTQLERIAGVQPPLQAYFWLQGQIYSRKGMWPEAIAALRPMAEAGEPRFMGLLGNTLARAGQRDEAERILADLMKRQERTGDGAFQIAMVYAGLGNADQVFAWLDKSVDDHSLGDMVMGYIFEDLRPDPRFQQLRKRVGLDRLASGKPDWR